MSKNDYILGADDIELGRLKIQHDVWLTEAIRGWNIADFGAGQKILDLGSGPGYCSLELAKLVGDNGKIIAVDKSKLFINYLSKLKEINNLSIKPILSDFGALELDSNTLDGVYCRWALAWIPNPQEILKHISKAIAPGGRVVIQEYYDWSTHQTIPSMPSLKKAIKASLDSFERSDSDINVGSLLPQYLSELGMKILNVRLMSKVAVPESNTWEWPTTFYNSYFPRLVKMGYIGNDDLTAAMEDLKKLKKLPYSTICCPLMVEVIAEKLA